MAIFGELARLGNVPWEAKGVDSGEGEYPLQDLAVTVAREFQTIVAISGEIDWISDGTTTYRVMGKSSYDKSHWDGLFIKCGMRRFYRCHASK